MASTTITFDEIEREMGRREQVERLRGVLEWMLTQGHATMPSSLDAWKQRIAEYHKAKSVEWSEPVFVPGPGSEMIPVHPPTAAKETTSKPAATATATALEYVHPSSSPPDDDYLLDLIMSDSDEEEEETTGEEEEKSTDKDEAEGRSQT